jgi:hypothetical protein
MPDPNLDAIRAARKEISAEFEHDPARLLKHYQELQEQFRGRVIQGPESLAAQQANAAGSDG